MALIEVKNVSKSFGDHIVLNDVSFTVETPEIIALVGPNGSGKSTLLNIMMNLLPADQGEVRFLGMDHRDYHVFNQVSFLKDNTVLYPYLNAEDHLLYAARCYGVSRAQMEEVIDYTGIRSFLYKKTVACSLGMKQLILLALAILNKPPVLVMDEPLNGLDPSNVIRVRELMLDMVHKGTCILLSSHTLSEIDAVTKHIFFLKDHTIHEEFLTPTDASERRTEDRYRELYGNEFAKS